MRQNPKRSIHVGGAGKIMSIADKLMPGINDKTSSIMIRGQFSEGADNTAGGSEANSLRQPGQDVQISGNHSSIRRSVFTNIELRPALGWSLMALAATGIGLVLARKVRS